MRNTILIILFITLTISLFAQGIEIPKDTTVYSYKKLVPSQQEYSEPLFFIDGKIAGQGAFSNIETSDLKDIQVIKSGQDFSYPNLTASGVVLIYLKKPLQLPTKKITEINHFFALDDHNPTYLNGYLIEDHLLEIYTNAIQEIEKVTPNKEINLQQEVLNIWTFSREQAKENSMTSPCHMLSR